MTEDKKEKTTQASAVTEGLAATAGLPARLTGQLDHMTGQRATGLALGSEVALGPAAMPGAFKFVGQPGEPVKVVKTSSLAPTVAEMLAAVTPASEVEQ